MRVLTENLVQREVCLPHRQPGVETSYTDFLATHPTMFAEAIDPLEADNWLCIIESKFGLLHCSEIQKTLFMAQQLRGPMSAWWANFTATIQDGFSWAPHPCGLDGSQASGVLTPTTRFEKCVRVQQQVQPPLSVRLLPRLTRRRCRFSVRGSVLCCVST
jgi:hypothetical protein